MKPMASTGSSAGYKSAQENHLRIGNNFLSHTETSNPADHERWGSDFMQVPEVEVNTIYFWGMAGTFIATVAVIKPGHKNAGQGYDSQSAEVIFNGLMNSQRERFKHSASTRTKVRACARSM